MCLHHVITRRRAFGLIIATVAAGFARARAVESAGPYDGPFVDGHSHLRLETSPSIDVLMGLYDGAGVRGVHLFGEPWMVASDASNQYRSRVIAYLAEGYANAVHPDSSYVNPGGLEELLSGRYVRGLGEMILRHSPYQLGAAGGYASAPANNVPADHPALIEAYRLAALHGVPVNVHQEYFFGEELERALRAAPDTTFVWAHAGHGPANAVRGLLARNPNLMADLSARTPWIGPGTVLLLANGTMAPEWSTVLHDFPDRFVVGLDLFSPAHYQTAYVNQMVTYYRGLLGQLDPGVARLIGHANAERIAPFGAGS